MNYYIVCYDIADDDTRREVSKTLGKHGDRVQKSVFEVRLHSETELLQLREALKQIVGESPEVRLYRLCKRCQKESCTLNDEKVAFFPSTIIF